jgi:type IV secretion system protein VirB11
VTRGIRSYLDEPRVIEIMLNSDGRIWVDRAGEGMSATDTTPTAPEAEAFLRFVATESDATLTRDHPTLAGTLPHWGARVQGWIPPAVSNPAFNIRKPPSLILRLEDYVEKGGDHRGPAPGADPGGAAAKKHSRARRDGDGQDHLCQCSASRDRGTDAGSLQCRAPNVLFVRTVRDRYTTRDAVFDALRGRPDRIIVGELRDGTALDLLKAWNTGHPGGVATIHANDTGGMLQRFCQLVEEVIRPAPRDAVAEAVNVCVHLTLDVKAPAGRRLSGLDAVRGYDRRQDRWLLDPLS